MYLNSDEEFMATSLIEGDKYVADSNRVYDKLKPLIINGSG